MIKKPLELKREGIEKAEEFLADYETTQARFNRVTELIEGFETPYAMELLSSVHWVATREGATTSTAVVKQVHAWSDRKSMFPDKHIFIAFDVLQEQGWLNQRETINP